MFFVAIMHGFRRRWWLIMLDKCSVMNIDICASFGVEHCIGGRETMSPNSRESEGKWKRRDGGLVDNQGYKWLAHMLCISIVSHALPLQCTGSIKIAVR